MRHRIAVAAFAVAAALPSISAADDLTGQERFLCTAVDATRCMETGSCTTELPWNLNIPQFMEVDLKAKTVGTVAGTGEQSTRRRAAWPRSRWPETG